MKKNTVAALLGSVIIASLLLTGCTEGSKGASDGKPKSTSTGAHASASPNPSKSTSENAPGGTADPSGAPAAPAQSVADACTIFQGADAALAEALSAAMANVVSDPSAESTLTAPAEAFETALEQITNQEISAKAQLVVDALKTFNDALATFRAQFTADPSTADNGALIDAASKLAGAEQAVNEMCSA